ncbi:MAG: ankyrin repeat domain-containing protein [Devosia sp.]|jgi:ankyrin repeat protein|uniref:ankyrin repeat domain-containing protein n=1 Tax=unclassified Devosia TaxID=196773 RepID=UPI0019F2D6DA|nr:MULTISPECIES: ankyrin repeat domain-containing protein [unclassified Devosia]MBF0679444.1 ankyrin repeat domain-containing protein [Devosia sp.]WEJ32674.1 ankyrin repeat domain-containing protein [Devosia sp. SD17-2]
MRKLILLGVLGMVLTSNAAAAILTAVEQGDIPALETAIAAGEDIEQRNARGQTPLLVAVWNNDLDAATRLVAAGADVNAKDAIDDSPYLVAGAHGRVEILKLLLANGADLASTNRYGGTALIPAAEKGHPEAVALLIEAGVDIDHVNNLGWTALLEAVILTDGGPTAQQIVKLLLDAGADRTIPDRDGITAIQHAKTRNFTEIAALLEAE